MANDKVTYTITVDSAGAVISVKKLDDAIDGLDKKTTKSTTSMSSLLNTLKPSPMMIAAGAFAAVGAGISFATRKTIEFDKQMSAVKAITNATDADMASLRETALKFGSSTEFTATQAGKGLEFLGMAGFNAKQSIEALPGVLNLASASGIELGKSADIASNILSQFRKPASETANVVDILAKTVTSSNQNMEQLADAMNYLGPTAAALKIPLSEAAAVTGVMANNGLQGSLGTRALGTSMTRLTKPTKAMKEVMSELNLEFFNEQEEFVGLIGLTKELERATEGMTDKKKASTLATLFGAEAFQEMNILLATGSKGLEEMKSKLDESTGSAQKMADTRLDNLAGDITKLESATEGLAIAFGMELTSGLRGSTQAATDFINLLKDNKDEIVRFFEPFQTAGESTISIFEKLISLFSSDDDSEKSFFTKMADNINSAMAEVQWVLDFFDNLLSAILEVKTGLPEIGEGFKSIYDDVSSGFGLFSGEKEKDPKLDPNYVPTDTELGFGPTSKEQDVEVVKNTTPIVTTPATSSTAEALMNASTKSATSKIDTNVDKVSGSKTNNIYLNINKLVENLTVTTSNLTEGTAQIRDEIAKTLLTAANDVNLIAE